MVLKVFRIEAAERVLVKISALSCDDSVELARHASAFLSCALGTLSVATCFMAPFHTKI